jgi:hypothetical protein
MNGIKYANQSVRTASFEPARICSEHIKVDFCGKVLLVKAGGM